MKWKRKATFEEEVLWKLEALHHLYAELNNRADRKEFKRSWKEPNKWQLTKLPDGKWQFEWDVMPRGEGKATGDFNYCVECMSRFESAVLEKAIEPVLSPKQDEKEPSTSEKDKGERDGSHK